MKKIKYRFRPLILVVIISAVVIAVAGIALNIWRFVSADFADAYDYVSLSIALLVSVVGFVLFFAMLVSSSYKVTDEELILTWGFLKNKLPIKSMTRIVYEQTKEQLVVYYMAEDFFVLNAKTVDYLELVDELRKRNGKIVFEITSIEQNADNEKK